MAKGWSELTAANNAGINPRTVPSVEKGNPATYRTINALAKCYGISEDELPNWLAGADGGAMSVTAAGQPHLALHPYSGRWNMTVECSRWEGRDLVSGECVHVGGYLDLLIEVEGHNGVGTAHGELTVELLTTSYGESSARYASKFCVVDRVEQAYLRADGRLELRSRTFARHVESETGVPPSGLSTGDKKPGPTVFRWTLRPVEEGVLEGEYRVDEKDSRDVATVRLDRPPGV